MRFLLDTNVLAELIRPKPNQGLLSWMTQNELSSGISTLVLGELVKGAHSLPPGKRRQDLLCWIEGLEEQFDGRIVDVSKNILFRWGELSGTHRRKGNPLPVIDALMAATAIEHELILVTRNQTDFPKSVKVLSPWKKEFGPQTIE